VGDPAAVTPDDDAQVTGDYRIELLSADGRLAVRLYEGWEQDDANAHALRQLAAQTGNASWRTVLVAAEPEPVARWILARAAA
jgi:hypothetical protein